MVWLGLGGRISLAAMLVAVGTAVAAGQIANSGQAVAGGTHQTLGSPRALGSLSGRLTDLHSAPLDGVTVVLRNESTGAEARTTTQKNGSYRFTGLLEGAYTLVAVSARQSEGRLEGILVSAGAEARVQTAMELVAIAPEPVHEPAEGAEKAARLAAWPGLTNHRWIGAESATVEAAFSPVPLQPLALEGRLAETRREIPPVETAVVSFVFPGEKPDSLELVSRPAQRDSLLQSTISPGLGAPTPASIRTGLGAARVGNPAASAVFRALAAAQGLALSHAAASAELESEGIEAIRAAQRRADPATPAVATTLTAAQLQSLPVTGRRWQDFVLDTATASTQAGGSTTPSLRGAGQGSVDSAIDGVSTRLAFGGASGEGADTTGEGNQGGAQMAQAWAGGHGSPLAEAAIREVETAAGNSEVEGARAAGGRVNVATQRGGSGLHGQAFAFDRQNTWGAKNPFTQWVTETAPATQLTTPTFAGQPFTSPDHEIVWGIGAGSEIKRRKLFWFGALDSYDRNDPGIATVKHPDEFFAQPSNDQMQVLSERLGLSSSNPVAAGLGAYSPMLEALDGLLGPAPRRAGQWVGFGRVDWRAAERHRFTVEGIGARWNSPGGGLTQVSESYGSHSFGSSEASEEWLLGRWEAFVTPNLLAVTQGSAGRNILSAHAEAPSPLEQPFLSPSTWGQLPQMVVDSRYGFTIGNPSRFGQGSYPDEKLTEVQQSVDWVRGGLLVKAGFEVNHNADATGLLRNQTGTYYYSTVENFVSDALVFAKYGVGGELTPADQHNCDQTGKVWRDAAGQLRGLGYLPCYAYYSQVMGPSGWHLSTNDWAGYATAQWQPAKLTVLSAGLRWEREQMPPPMAELNNPELPLTERLPSLGNDWGPRLSLAVGNRETRWPILRLGYGMYFARTENATIETALTQTGSLKGDLNYFMRPTDNLNAGGAPPFPYVLAGPPGSVVRPGAVEFAPAFHNPEVHQAVAAVEETLPGHVQVTASALLSLARRLPVSIDTNFDPAMNPGTITYGVVDGTGAGPIKTTQITVPFYAMWPSANSGTGLAGRLNPGYQQITEILSRANSTYEAGTLKVARYGKKGLSLHAHYTYSHAMDWNPNESSQVAGSSLFDPGDFKQEYGTSNLDVRHAAAVMAIYEAPWKLRGTMGHAANGWMLSGVGQFRSGLPYTMRTSGSLTEEFNAKTGAAIVALAPGMNGSGGDNRVYGVGRNTYRYPATWKADLRLGKRFDLGHMRQLELMAETFNLFNHQNVTELETTGYYIEPGSLSGTLPTLNFLTGLKANTTAFGQPLNVNATNFYRERQIQFGMRMRF